MPVTAAPAPRTSVISIDKRQAAGAVLGLVCLGILVGFKLGSGEPLVIEKPLIVERRVPCAKCSERDQAVKSPWTGVTSTSGGTGAGTIAQGGGTAGSVESTPGDSSVPDDVPGEP
jgi:hypothetical protein